MSNDYGSVKQAMYWRAEYRLDAVKKHLPLSRVGVHPANRGGQYPQPGTVQNLTCKIIGDGFIENEASHEGVCAQEIPRKERESFPADWMTGSDFLEYKLKNCSHPFFQSG